MDNTSKISPNSIAFIGLANEYCTTLANAQQYEQAEFVDSMLKLLPRIYISATDISIGNEPEAYIEPYLDEDYYESVRHHVEMVMGPDDIYLEVFEADMKYSDTPISASIAEGLTDIFQDLFNFVNNVKDTPQEQISDYVAVCKENFETFWGQRLCNVMKALHDIKYNHDNRI